MLPVTLERPLSASEFDLLATFQAGRLGLPDGSTVGSFTLLGTEAAEFWKKRLDLR